MARPAWVGTAKTGVAWQPWTGLGLKTANFTVGVDSVAPMKRVAYRGRVGAVDPINTGGAHFLTCGTVNEF